MSPGLTRWLSKEDVLYLLELIHKSLSCTTKEELAELMKMLKCLVPFDFAVCLLGKKEVDGIVKLYNPVNINYPVEWIEIYLARKYQEIDPVAKENFTHFRLQRWSDTYRLQGPPPEFISLAEDFGLREGYTHGARNFEASEGSLFSLSGNSIEHNNRTEVILKLIVPHFHQTLVRIIGHDKRKNRVPLSPREKEVLNWIKVGKSTWEISVILGVSERTVKFHVCNVMQKLDAVTRTHAVAIALEQRLIDIE
ncbi:MAG TPA: LuxR family transcriptional regulator [Nitrospirae bacterium]|nr:LuxR family transcriptional regulator [Nitrospirota bacterium]